MVVKPSNIHQASESCFLSLRILFLDKFYDFIGDRNWFYFSLTGGKCHGKIHVNVVVTSEVKFVGFKEIWVYRTFVEDLCLKFDDEICEARMFLKFNDD